MRSAADVSTHRVNARRFRGKWSRVAITDLYIPIVRQTRFLWAIICRATGERTNGLSPWFFARAKMKNTCKPATKKTSQQTSCDGQQVSKLLSISRQLPEIVRDGNWYFARDEFAISQDRPANSGLRDCRFLLFDIQWRQDESHVTISACHMKCLTVSSSKLPN